MTQKEAMRKVVEFMNNQMPEYGLRPDMITGKTFAVVKTDNKDRTIATISSYYKPTDLLIWIDGFCGRYAFDTMAHTTA